VELGEAVRKWSWGERVKTKRRNCKELR